MKFQIKIKGENMRKVLMVFFFGVIMALIVQQSYLARSEKINSIYSDIFFTRLAVETGQYTRQIEYGIKNGKSLENFYNIQSVLSEVRRCSSYINGASIISKDSVLMYSLSDDSTEPPIRAAIPKNGAIYSIYKNTGSYIMAVPIYGRTSEAEGYLLLDLSEEAVTNSVAEIHRDNLIQSIAVSVLTFLLGTVLIIHLCRRRDSVFFDCAGVFSGTICAGLLVDSVLSAVKLNLTLDSLIQQSVSKIVMALQNDLDGISDKGVAISRIYDLNSWLFDSCQQVPFIDNLIYDKSYKISAIVYSGYATERTAGYILLVAGIIGICAAGLLAVCVICWLADKLNRKLEQRKSEDLKIGGKDRYSEAAQ